MTLSGKVAIVTGASRGLGRSIAEALAAAGATVVVNYASSAAAAEEVVAAITAAGGTAAALGADVSKPSEADRLIQDTVKTFGRLDILVNNAGVNRDNLTLRISEDDWDTVLDTNLKGAFNCSKAAMRPMIRARGGRILNITSVVGILGNAGQANYSAAKAGLIGLTKSLAREIGSRNITVNAIAPGFIDAGMTTTLTQQHREGALTQIPLERFGAAADVAAAVVFLASEAAGYITGVVLPVDGGMAM